MSRYDHPWARQGRVPDPPPSTRDGRYVVTEITWDANGSHDVTVADTASTLERLRAAQYEPIPRAARDLARRSVPMPHLTRWTRCDAMRHNREHITWHFTVSRLDPMYR